MPSSLSAPSPSQENGAENSNSIRGHSEEADHIPLVSDPIQGLFFSSSASTLVARLVALDLPIRRARNVCASDPGQYLYWVKLIAIAGAFMAVIGIAITVLFRPRPIINLIVRCNAMMEDCVEAVRRAMTERR